MQWQAGNRGPRKSSGMIRPKPSYNQVNVKSFPNHIKAHGAALISVSLALSQTPAYIILHYIKLELK